jgi:hypothetical protein
MELLDIGGSMGTVPRHESVPNSSMMMMMMVLFCLSKKTPLLNGIGFLAGTLIA